MESNETNKQNMQKKNTGFIISLVVLYVVSSIGAYLFFSRTGMQQLQKPPLPMRTANGTIGFDQSLPKTEECPLNGAKYSTQQRSWWETHRPMAVMVENHSEARPQSGLSFADVVYEAVAEGGITRFAAIFYCQDAPQVGPIRSARTYFIDWISEYGNYPLYVHVGGANADGPADALSQLNDYGWANYNDMNQFSIGFPTFWRDSDRLGHPVATEHTMYSTTGKLWDLAKTRGLTNLDKEKESWDTTFSPYTFKDDEDASSRGKSQALHLEFWTGDEDYYVDWQYNPTTNEYMRKNGGAAHADRDTNKQLTTKNLVILSMEESHANDGYEGGVHLLYDNKGTGKAVVFMDGKQIKATWSKKSRTARTIISDMTGKPIAFNRGKLWFEILPLDGVLTLH